MNNEDHINTVGVILVNLGTPVAATPQAIRLFLKQFLADKRVIDLPRWLWLPILYSVVLPLRCKKVAENYQRIWWSEGSPLRVVTERQCDALGRYFTLSDKRSAAFSFAMTYGEPSIAQAITHHVKHKQVKKLIILPLFPQFSLTTTQPVIDQVVQTIEKQQLSVAYHIVEDYHDHPLYIDALAATITRHFEQYGKTERLLMSFHGIPRRYWEKGDDYPHRCRKTAKLLADTLGLSEDEWQLSFQSRFGRAEWVKPYTSETLQRWAKQAVKSVTVISPGFSADCLETLEELAVENRQLFLDNGGEKFYYIKALNHDQLHIEMMANLVDKAIGSHSGEIR